MRSKNYAKLFAILLIAALFASCANVMRETAGSSASGSLHISTSLGSSKSSVLSRMASLNTRTIQPASGLTIASYSYSLVGPNGETPTDSDTGSSSTITGLATGSWTVTVTGYNGASTPVAIYSGSGSFAVIAGQSSSASVALSPSGTGSVSITLSLPSSLISSISGSIQNLSGGTLTDISAKITGGSGTWTYTDSLAAGSYQATFQLKNSSATTIATIVESVDVFNQQSSQSTITETASQLTQLSAPLAPAITEGDGQLSLSFVTVSGATGYNVYLSSNGGTSYSKTSASPYSGSTTSISSLTNGTEYMLYVTAVNSLVESAASPIQSATPSAYDGYLSATIGTMLPVSGGSFQRDSTSTNVETITSFHMSKYPITRAQFAAVMGSDQSQTGYSTGTSDPVQYVNWYQAIAFCNKLSLLEGRSLVYSVSTVSDWSALSSIPTADDTNWDNATMNISASGYRLPTEMEFMWAAMGGNSDSRSGDIVGGVNTGGYTKGYSGSTETGSATTNINGYAWTTSNGGGTTHPVGSKYPNELGLYDLSGNVYILCWDWYQSSYSSSGSQTDPTGPSTGTTNRGLIRGGSWNNATSYCALAYRNGYTAINRYQDIGFRVVFR